MYQGYNEQSTFTESSLNSFLGKNNASYLIGLNKKFEELISTDEEVLYELNFIESTDDFSYWYKGLQECYGITVSFERFTELMSCWFDLQYLVLKTTGLYLELSYIDPKDTLICGESYTVFYSVRGVWEYTKEALNAINNGLSIVDQIWGIS
jgi:hypothetical protein